MADKNTVRIEQNQIAITFEPDRDLISAVRTVAAQHGGTKVHVEREMWHAVFPLTAKDDVAKHFVALTWNDAFRQLMRGSSAKFQTASESINVRLIKAAGDMTKPLPDGRVLYEHQRDGIEWLINTPRGILADDMGLGKTLQSLFVARLIYEVTRAHTVVITRASLIDDWRKEQLKLNHRVVSFYSWAKIPKPTPGQHYVLIADEAHFAKDETSVRGKAFQEWAEASDFVFMLTGTPMINGRHLDLFALLKACRHPIAENKQAYEKKFCGAKRMLFEIDPAGKMKYPRDIWIDDTKFEIRFKCRKCQQECTQRWNPRWKKFACACGHPLPQLRTWQDKGEAKNPEELSKQIAPYYLRRLKTECLDLPPKTRVIRQVEITPTMHAAYSEGVQKAKAAYKERVRNGQTATEGEALVILGIIRRAASIAKAEAAIELAQEACEEGSQPIIFTEFLESAKLIAAHFKVTPYIGNTKVDQKTRIVSDFQAGKQRQFVGTRAAGGTGLTLVASNVVIAVDRPLCPGEIDQAEDRAYRIGQIWPVTAYWLRAFPVCEKIDGFIETKQRAIDALFGEKSSEQTKEISARQVLLSLFES